MGQHKFDPNQAKKLDSPARLKQLPPDELVEMITEVHGRWADLGCGTGSFTVALAKRANQVTGIDISQQMLNILEEKIKNSGIKNIDTALSEELSIPVQDNTFDGVVMFFVAHEADSLTAFLQEVHRILKKNGQIVVVDFDEDSTVGPPADHRLCVDDLVCELENAGFAVDNEWDFQSEPDADGRIAMVYGIEAAKQ